ncbi:MAG: transcription elongation factor Spt5 [Promethearchaeota archaeon]
MTENKSNVQKSHLTTIFAVRTTIGRERAVQRLIFNRLRTINPLPDLKAILTSEQYRGYVFIEAVHQRDVLHITTGVPHVKGKVVGSIPFDSMEEIINPKKVIKIMDEGDIIEVTSGLFQNNKAIIIQMPNKESGKEEVTVRLLDSDSPITVKIHADFLKLIDKAEKVVKEYVISNEEQGKEKKDETLIEEAEQIADGLRSEDTVKEETTKVMLEEEIGNINDDTFSFNDMEEEEDWEDEGGEKYRKKDENSGEEDDEDEEDWSKFMEL